MATFGEGVDQAIKTILLSTAASLNLGALTYFLGRHIKSGRDIRPIFAVQMLGHLVASIYPISKIVLIFANSIEAQYFSNVSELLLMMIEPLYYLEIFVVFGTFQKALSMRTVRICQALSPLIVLLLGGNILFKGIYYQRATDPGFWAKWSATAQFIFILLPCLALFVSRIAFKVFDNLMTGFAEAKAQAGNKVAIENLRRMKGVLIVFVILVITYFMLNIVNGIFSLLKNPNISLINHFSYSVLSAQFAIFAILLYFCSTGITRASNASNSTHGN